MIEKWIVSVQDGRTEDYSAIVELYQRRIFIYCCRMLENEQEAEDAAQDIFVKAYQSIQSYRPTAGFSAWLYKIAYRHCLNVLRRRRLQLHKRALFQPDKSVESPEEIVDRQLFSPPLDSVLKFVGTSCRSERNGQAYYPAGGLDEYTWREFGLYQRIHCTKSNGSNWS
ncbi:hypothetical protein PALU110988_01305 [Paenibacillus lupini]